MAAIAGELGAIRLPVAAADPFPDPALDVLGAYLAAYLRTYAGAAWLSLAPGEPIVKHVHKGHDPQEHDFTSGGLPALYLFREGSARDPVQLAEDFRVHADNVRVFWVLPPGQQFRSAKFSRAVPLLAKLLDKAIDEGRDPCWVQTDDPDPTAADEGSVVIRHAGLRSMMGGRWRRTNLLIKVTSSERDGDFRDGYPCLETQIVIEEEAKQLFGRDPLHPERGDFGSADTLAGPAELVATITHPDGTVIVEARFLSGYSMLYFQDGSAAQSIGTSPAKLSSWTGSGPTAGLTDDAGAGTITVRDAGVYMVSCSLTVTGTTGRVVQARLRKNDVEEPGAGTSATLAAGRTPMAFVSALVSCEAGDVLSLYCEADATDAAFTPIDGVLSALRVGAIN